MQDRIRKVMKGNREAALSLYDEHKETVYSLCHTLLLEEKEADRATSRIFKKLFEELLAGRIPNEAEFARLSIRKTVTYCKAIAAKKSSRAFRVPVNANFSIGFSEAGKIYISDDMQQTVLINLPTFHRFIYVLNTLCEYSAEQIALIFATSVRNIENALLAEQGNVDKIVASARHRRTAIKAYTTQDFHTDLVQTPACVRVPGEVNLAVVQIVNNLCEPIRKNREEKGKIVLLASALTGLLAIVIVAALSFGGNEPAADAENADPDNDSLGSAASVLADAYYADIEIENYGTVTVKLDAVSAPKTVANFIALAEDGFYDGLTFHRIMDGFMMQGGDPNGDGTGNSDETVEGEFSANGYDNPLSHTAGAISMARSDDYDSASCQFFIVHTDDYVDVLDGYYACFGYVTEGMYIVESICSDAEPTDDDGTIPAEDQPVIVSITVREAEETEETEASESTESTQITEATDTTDSTDAAA